MTAPYYNNDSPEWQAELSSKTLLGVFPYGSVMHLGFCLAVLPVI